MPDSNNRLDAGQLWRNWLTETERQWNAFFNDVMGTDSFGRFLGGYMEIYGTFQRLVAQNLERSLGPPSTCPPTAISSTSASA
ncbi:MAG: hypothetical protein E3J29_01430 [Dehalococcoidia bacterium]|nr:MAG: hypothetical protein E3J29_01430 [Dehalococcoidia bacterium]